MASVLVLDNRGNRIGARGRPVDAQSARALHLPTPPRVPRQAPTARRSTPRKARPERPERPKTAHPPPRAVERLLVRRARQVRHLLLGCFRPAREADDGLVLEGACLGRRRGGGCRGRGRDGQAPAVPSACRDGIDERAPSRLAPASRQLAMEPHARRLLDPVGWALHRCCRSGGQEAGEERVLQRRVAELRHWVGRPRRGPSRLFLSGGGRGRGGIRGGRGERRVGELRVAQAERAGRVGSPA